MPKNNISLPAKIGKKIKPPMTRAQLVAGLVEVKLADFNAKSADLLEKMNLGRAEAARLIGESISKLPAPDIAKGFDCPNEHDIDKEGRCFLVKGSWDYEKLTPAAKASIKKFKSADEEHTAHFRSNGIYGFSGQARLRKMIRQQVVEGLKRQAGTDTQRVPELLKTPTEVLFWNVFSSSGVRFG